MTAISPISSCSLIIWMRHTLQKFWINAPDRPFCNSWNSTNKQLSKLNLRTNTRLYLHDEVVLFYPALEQSPNQVREYLYEEGNQSAKLYLALPIFRSLTEKVISKSLPRFLRMMRYKFSEEDQFWLRRMFTKKHFWAGPTGGFSHDNITRTAHPRRNLHLNKGRFRQIWSIFSTLNSKTKPASEETCEISAPLKLTDESFMY